MSKQNYNISAYTLNALNNLPPMPIVAKRAPTSADLGYQLGQLWIYTSSNVAYILTSVVSNSALWSLLEAGSGSGVFSTLTSTANSTIATGASTVNSFGSGSGSVNTIGSAAGASSTTISVGTGNFSLDGVGASTYSVGASTTTGTINIGGTGANTGIITIAGGTGAQTLNIAASGTGAKAINIGATGSADTISIGSTTAGSTLALKTPTSTPVVAANGLTATVGNLTATNGNVVLSTAATRLVLPGPVNIMTGAGVPSNGLAVNVGDMYINTTASTTTTRLYIASAASTWVTFTTSA